MAKDIDLSGFDEEVAKYDLSSFDEPERSLSERIGDKAVAAKDYVVDRAKATGENLVESGEDLAKGVTQGATLGFADEAGGAIATGLDYGQRLMNRLGLAEKSPGQINEELKAQGFKGNLPSEASEIYRQGQQETAQDFAESEERSPWLYKGGELAAGIASGIAATPASSSSGAKLIDILRQQGGKEFAKEAGKRAAIAGLQAAPAGLAAGAGYSEGKLVGATPEEQEQLLTDTLKGGATASALAGGIKLASDVAPVVAQKASEYIDDTVKNQAFLRQTKKAYDIGRAGEGLRGEPAKDFLDIADKKVAGIISDDLFAARDALGENLKTITDQATQAGKVINPNSDLISKTSEAYEVLSSNPKMLGNTTTESTKEALEALARGDLNPQQAYALRKSLKDIANNAEVPFEIRSTFKRFNQSLTNGLEEQVSGFKQALKDYHDYSSSLEQFPKKGVDLSKESQYGKLDKDKFTKLMTTRIQEGGKLGTANKDIRTGFNEMVSALESNPKLLKKSGLNLAELKKAVAEQGDVSSIWQGVHGYEPHSTFGKHVGWLDTGLAKTYGISHGVGKAVTSLGKMSQWPAEKLSSVAQKLKMGTSKHLGEALENAIAKGDKFKQNAVIFTILQTPSAKSELEGEFQSDEGAE